MTERLRSKLTIGTGLLCATAAAGLAVATGITQGASADDRPSRQEHSVVVDPPGKGSAEVTGAGTYEVTQQRADGTWETYEEGEVGKSAKPAAERSAKERSVVVDPPGKGSAEITGAGTYEVTQQRADGTWETYEEGEL